GARKIEGNVHQIHTLNRTIECGECHGEIVHGDFGKNQALAPECAKCHGGKHSEVSAFYSGTLLKGVEQFPGAMFLAQVSCEGCHEIGGYMKEMSGASTPLTLIDGIALNCVKCHGEKYGPMLRRWTGEIQAGMDFLKKEAVKAAVLDYSESILAGMKSKITDTLKNLELLYAGIPYHNVLYALIFMNEAKDTLFSVTKSSGEDIPVVLQGVDKNCLSLCHEFTGLPEKTTFKALKMDFPHQYHLDMELACVKCHEVKNHLKRKTGTEPCKECHDLKDFKTETK
ncbi:MAG: hypothetical protein FJ088_04735, partial [Deltaproteobacteria bacterium]|nr:hypothetical protein [Deltaproteobacteria bacterium]